MFKLLIATAGFSVVFIFAVAFAQEGGGGGQDCAQYQTQCKNGSGMASQGQQDLGVVFPGAPRPTESSNFNQTAAQQQPYCEGMAAACENQQTTTAAPTTQAPTTQAAQPAQPAAPVAPSMPGGR